WHREESLGTETSRSDAQLAGEFGQSRGALRKFAALGLLSRRAGNVRLTSNGRRRAARLVRAHRLWERYLTEHAAFTSDHVHDDADRLERWIDEPRQRMLAERLGHPPEDPHGSPIPPDDKEEAK